jgi:hypothetical protein
MRTIGLVCVLVISVSVLSWNVSDADRRSDAGRRARSAPAVDLKLPEAGLRSGTAGKRLEIAEPQARALRDNAPRARAPQFGGVSWILAEYDFEDGMGGPDPQGWVGGDLTVQEDTFFHVDDFSGLAGYAPLEGSQSLWCGARPGPEFCHYDALPGYGNLWGQDFESVAFPASGDVTLSFLVSYDCEPRYDNAYAQYLSKSGIWQTLLSFNQQGSEAAGAVIAADSLAGSVKIRFRFISNAGWSDEDYTDTDGAVIIDDIRLEDAVAVLDTQDFETEGPGAKTTSDGDWTAKVVEPFGDYSGLFDGSTVLQEDPLVTNDTYFWGFFNGSPDDYSCGGHPLQPVVPFTSNPGSESALDYLNNQIRSPWIDLTHDKDGLPVPAAASVVLAFDVYRDLPFENFVFYQYSVRSMVDGCATVWRDGGLRYGLDAQPDWYRFSAELFDDVEPGATEIQVSIRAADYLYYYPSSGYGDCHSHAPLFDNVTVALRTGVDTLVVTNTNDSGPGSLRQAIIDANALADSSFIAFDIPGPGPHVIRLTSELPKLARQVVIDGTTQPGGGTVELNGYSTEYECGLRIQSDGCVIRGLRISGFDYYGVFIDYANGTRIEANEIFSNGSGGVWVGGHNNVVEANDITWNGDCGVQVIGDNNMVGGTSPGVGNHLTGNRIGVIVYGGTGNSIRSNEISANTNLGIDLDGDGVTPNDALDVDTGANDLQNYPFIGHVDARNGDIRGLLQSEPNTTYDIDVYASRYGCDPSGYGEGGRYLGSTTATTDGSGIASFEVYPDVVFQEYEAITATATNPSGSTSEFSACVSEVSGSYVTNTDDSGAGSLRQAILDANASPGFEAILFNIPGTGPHTIAPLTALPSITDPVIIDGYSYAGCSENTAGTWESGNAVIGIVLDGSALSFSFQNGLQTNVDGCIIRGLAIGNFPGSGIELNSSENDIEGCYIGTDASGTTAAPNDVGVRAAVNCDDNMIGGGTPDTRNVISGNTAEGVLCLTAFQNTVRGNFIGVDATGSAGLGNGAQGVRLGEASYHKIWYNVISANGAEGVAVRGPTTTAYTTVRNNRIGTDVTGTADLGNGAEGVEVYVGVADGQNISVGGAPAYKNLIAYNTGTGVSVQLPVTGLATVGYNEIYSNGKGVVVTDPLPTHTVCNIVGNSIHSNAGLGIDLGDDGVTPNDAGDVDTGPNGLQNFPVLSQARPGTTSDVVVSGMLDASPSTTYLVEFFSSPTGDASGYGEGQTYLGSDLVATDVSGQASFDAMLYTPVPGGHYVTATARPETGYETSEFSNWVVFVNTETGTDVEVAPIDPATGQTPVALTFDEVTGDGYTTLEITESGPAVPDAYIVGGTTTYYDLATTADYVDSITVCIYYDDGAVPLPEGDLVLLHYDTTPEPDEWVEITASLDTVANVICGRSATLSPFILARPNPASGAGSPPVVPNGYALYQNVPNPFNPTTVIRYDVPEAGTHVTLQVFDVQGRLIATLVDGVQTAGRMTATWDGTDRRGGRVASGIYFCRMIAGNFVQARKMLLIK